MTRPRSAAVPAYGGRFELTDLRLDLTVDDVDKILASVSNGAFETTDKMAKVRRRPKSAPSYRPVRVVERPRYASTARLDDDGMKGVLNAHQSSIITPPCLPPKRKQAKAKKIPHYQTDCGCPMITEYSVSSLDTEKKPISIWDKKKIKNDALKGELLKIRLLEQKLQRESLNAALLRIQNKGMKNQFERGNEILSEEKDCVDFNPLSQFEKSLSCQIDNDWDKCFVASRKSKTMERLLDEYEEKEEYGRREVWGEHRSASDDQKCLGVISDGLDTTCKMKRKDNENQLGDEKERNGKDYNNIEEILERLQISISKNQEKILQQQNFFNVANFPNRKGDKGRGKENKKFITRKLENLILDTDQELSSKAKSRDLEGTKIRGKTGNILGKDLNENENTRSSLKTRIRSINIHAQREEMVRMNGFVSFFILFIFMLFSFSRQ